MTGESAKVVVRKVEGGNAHTVDDCVAVEEPLEIRLGYSRGSNRVRRSISITMRTPGHDEELAVGFLFTEGIIRDRDCIESIAVGVEQSGNIVTVELKSGVAVEIDRLERHFYTTSSCGVCGKASLEALKLSPRHPMPPPDEPRVPASLVHQFPALLRDRQSAFASTGGMHASALLEPSGNLIAVREDVGRHNAVDKLVGRQVLAGRVPLSGTLLFVSGRTSFEILQKALAAGLPWVAGIGAPSSLAVEVADSFGMTLSGFVRDNRYNVYSGAGRIVEDV